MLLALGCLHTACLGMLAHMIATHMVFLPPLGGGLAVSMILLELHLCVLCVCTSHADSPCESVCLPLPEWQHVSIYRASDMDLEAARLPC